MSKITKAGIKELIDRYQKTYIDNPAIMLSGYTQEIQTVADYSGRQLLELMQNADDAKSDVIFIELNTQNQFLKISNNGDAFSLEGVESLMYTGLSTKNKMEYIGNKGLGFRSILNWVRWVEIKTQDISFRFSKNHSETFYTEHIAEKPLVKERVAKEIAAKKMAQGEKPIAALAFPEIINEKNQDYITTVVLHFKENELEKIEEQIDAISEELLLFLPNIKQIRVEKNGTEIKNLRKTLDQDNEIVINDSHWKIYRKDDQTFEKVKFKYAIAWKEDLSVEGMFYNYFPTDVPTQLPCIIHATFDLTNNRKEINETGANLHILQEIAQSLGEVAENFLKAENSDWRAYEFLNHHSADSRKVLKTFFETVAKLRNESTIYPTVNNQYNKKTDATYHGEAFSNWVQEAGAEEHFEGLLKPVENRKLNISKRLSLAELQTKIETINHGISLDQRVELLGILAKNEDGTFDTLHNSTTSLPLLLNKNGNVVDTAIKVFTKDTEGDDLVFPDYINDIEFILPALYENIRLRYNEEIQTKKYDTESGDARAVKRFLDPVVNIGLDDITGVIQQIVSETNKIISGQPNPAEILKQMVTSLFSIFKSNPDRRGNLTTIEHIPLIAISGKKVFSDDLYFGKGYAVGEVSTLIFEGIRKDDDYLADNTFWNLDGDEELRTKFFQWLNVNGMSKFTEREEKFYLHNHNDFTRFVIEHQENQSDYVHKHYKVNDVVGFPTILKHPLFSVEKLIIWLMKDAKLAKQLTVEHLDEFKISYSNAHSEFHSFPSYLQFQINKSGILDDTIAGNAMQGFDGLKTVDMQHPLFKIIGVEDFEIQKAIHLLGIKKSLNEVHPDKIYDLLKSVDKTKEDNSQSFYKLLYEYFKENEETQLKDYELNFEGITYISRKGGLGKAYQAVPVEEVYYSDNKLLPQQILDNYWFINLPKRIGENRVAKFFGVKLIKDIVNNISFNIEAEHPVAAEFAKYINKLKPYFLAYRLEMLTKDLDKKEAANSIKQLQIHLVKKASYQLNGQQFDCKDFDFIPKNNTVVLQYSRSLGLEHLQKDADFCDVIAEIICVVFKVADAKNIYRRIFKDGTKDAHHILRSDEKEDLLVQANKLLGVSVQELDFWKKVFPTESFVFDTDEELKNAIEKLAQSSLPECYPQIDFENWRQSFHIDFLHWVVQNSKLDIQTILQPKDLEIWHLNKIDNVIKDHLSLVEKLLCQQANESADDKLKRLFYEKARQFESAKETIFQNLELDKIVVLDANYFEAIHSFIKEKFSIDLNVDTAPDLDLHLKYNAIVAIYSFGDNVDDMIKILRDHNTGLYSLMFFEGFEDQIKEACENFQKKITENQNNEEQEDEEECLPIFEGSTGSAEINLGAGNKKSGGGGSHTSKTNRQKAAIGKKQEHRVKKCLEQNGYVVNHVSTKTDGKHYDFEYKKKDEEQWRFLEVKNDSGGYFFLSKDEKNTALKPENIELYDVALVNDNGIYIINNFFNLRDSSFEHNQKFIAEPTEYKIHFELNTPEE